MKTLFFKNMLPAGVIALALAGAFATTSMQSASKKSSVSYRQGFNALANGKCGNIAVDCDDDPINPLCHISGTTGPLAYDNQSNNCVIPLYKPVN
ncbi:hypothetical protein HNP37_004656 [Flavobacterium nitrogenifigens]|uniref:Uncharacterized protein n=2 Tax=Flavobacterium TaxID=237 RepID=A0A7W7NAI7_9FLAO|nr:MULTISPECIES: DUF6520 family protein [Flavobacterium]MBB4804559.1 hypothetical protein [Flavobacterium nitrogenifigens]MBB6389518.1 hypothetical protein [Flavobacterium notoginsengisoli]